MAGGGMMMQETKVDLRVLGDHLARYAFAASFVKGKLVLDSACGVGYGSRYLFGKGMRAVVGGEISAGAVEAAQKCYGGSGVEFAQLDVTRLPFADSSFDAMVSLETIEHLERYRDYLGECNRVLKSGGMFVCSTPNKGHGIPEMKEFSPYHVHEFYLDEFKELLSEFFTDVELYGQDCWRRVEKIRWRIRLRLEKATKPILTSIPKAYETVRYLDRRFIKHMHTTQLNQMVALDEISIAPHRPFSLVGNSLVPKTIIAVARK